MGAVAQDTWEWDGGGDSAIGFDVNMTSARIPTSALSNMHIRAHCGGSRASATGATLYSWSNGLASNGQPGEWLSLKSNESGFEDAALIDWQSSEPTDALRYLFQSGIHLLCRAALTSDNAHQTGTVAMDYIEARLRYQLPPVCGNGALEADESCDDGNSDDGDGCSASCLIE